MADTLVWISGASSGIGAALVKTLPYRDAHVVDISRSGGTPHTEHLPADLSDPAAWSAVGAHFLARLAEFGGSRVAFIHAAATLLPIGLAAEVDAEGYRHQVLLNAAAPQVLGQAFLQALDQADFQGQAHLVILSSGAASTPHEGLSAYGAAKAAVDMWVRTTGAEQRLRDGRCTVLAIGPGSVATDMQSQIRTADPHDFPDVEHFRRLHREGRLASPEDAARGIWQALDHGLDSGTVA